MAEGPVMDAPKLSRLEDVHLNFLASPVSILLQYTDGELPTFIFKEFALRLVATLSCGCCG